MEQFFELTPGYAFQSKYLPLQALPDQEKKPFDFCHFFAPLFWFDNPIIRLKKCQDF